jgi:hypothetical protein
MCSVVVEKLVGPLCLYNFPALPLCFAVLAVPETYNAAAAINQLVEDTTQGKFESTNNAQDEVVLLNIVQVRLQA